MLKIAKYWPETKKSNNNNKLSKFNYWFHLSMATYIATHITINSQKYCNGSYNMCKSLINTISEYLPNFKNKISETIITNPVIEYATVPLENKVKPEKEDIKKTSKNPYNLTLDDKIKDIKITKKFISPVKNAEFTNDPKLIPGSPRTYRGKNARHEGWDFYQYINGKELKYGDETRSTNDGIVIYVDKDFKEMTKEEHKKILEECIKDENTSREHLKKLSGQEILIYNGIDTNGNMFISKYSHLSGISENIEIGKKVKRGEVIGYTGNSGTTNGVLGNKKDTHLHFEILASIEYNFETFFNHFINMDDKEKKNNLYKLFLKENSK